MRSGRLAALSLATLALLGVRCGGGGSGTPTSPPPPPPPPPPPMGVFFTAEATPEEGSIYLAADEAELDGTFELRVEAERVEALFGLAFQLRFPNDLLSFRPNLTDEGDLMSGAGEFETAFEVARFGDLVTVGLTRLGEVEGAVGSGRLLTLRFAVRDAAEGEGALDFERNDTRDPRGRIQEGVGWIAGSIEVLR